MKELFAQRPVVQRPLAELSIHPRIAKMPRLDKSDPRYKAMKASWIESGIIPPIYVTKDGQIADGRHRFWFAQDMQLDDVSVIEVTEDEVPMVVLNGLSGRNHQTKGQRAYFAIPYLQAALDAAKSRRLQILKSGGKSKLPALETMEDLAAQIGVGEETMRQASKIHAAFLDDPKLRKEWEPKILDPEEPMGLGFVCAGIGGAKGTKGQPKKPKRNSALNNFTVGWKNLAKPAAHYAKWNDEERDTAAEAVRHAIVRLPDELLDVVVAAIKAVRKNAKQQGEQKA